MNAQGVYLIFQIFKGSFIGEGRLLQSTQYQEKTRLFIWFLSYKNTILWASNIPKTMFLLKN